MMEGEAYCAGQRQCCRVGGGLCSRLLSASSWSRILLPSNNRFYNAVTTLRHHYTFLANLPANGAEASYLFQEGLEEVWSVRMEELRVLKS